MFTLFQQQAISFPVHSMGWVVVNEEDLGSSDTVSNCISDLADQRKDLWKTNETWGEVSYDEKFVIPLHTSCH